VKGSTVSSVCGTKPRDGLDRESAEVTPRVVEDSSGMGREEADHQPRGSRIPGVDVGLEGRGRLRGCCESTHTDNIRRCPPSASSGGGAHIPELMVRSVRSFELESGKRVSGEVRGVVECVERSCDVEGVVMPANCTNVSLVLFPNLSNYVSSMSIEPADDARGSDHQEKGSRSTCSKDRDTIVHEELFGDTFKGRSAP
ncbi:hypothetical protein FOZ62_013003, partial [Perkinsus olseni]